ncbi:MAG: 4-hydroxybenzoate octaprenyltransferase [Coxiellaceae bacterium]|nr:4-hydroxybenzoate octaprenyltransferase [Coxiellaceae bacterium]
MSIKNYFQLMRFHKPIGILLLLWPTLWALWIAAEGTPQFKNIFIFTAGVIVMRAAGCVINDIADRKLDKHITRTKDRPLTAQKIKTHQAIYLFCLLCAIAFMLVLLTNLKTILISIIAVLIATIYPFMKRYTHFPQLALGIAFSCSIPMAFTAENQALSGTTWILFLANILWTIAYDTEYAMLDREDDIKIGIKSTAILFGKYDRIIIGVLQGIFILLMGYIGLLEQFSIMYFVGLFLAITLFFYQQRLMPKRCMDAFLNNQWVGLIVFIAVILSVSH